MGFETEEYGKLGGMESTSTLFEKVVPVRVTKANAEDRHMDLTARFIMGLSKIHRSTKVRTYCGWFDLPYVTQLNIQAEDHHHKEILNLQRQIGRPRLETRSSQQTLSVI